MKTHRAQVAKTDTGLDLRGYWIHLCCCVLLAAACSPSDVEPAPIDENSYEGTIRVACVGDSLTFGANLEDRGRNAYSAQLGRLLGAKWETRNFGCPGTTVLKASKTTPAGLPYVEQKVYAKALAFQPHVVILQFGGNDADPRLWGKHRHEFKPDYRELIQSFADLPTKPRIWLCIPSPCIPVENSKRLGTLTDEVIPRIREVAAEQGLPLIDFFVPLWGKWELFPDKVHPDAEGTRIITETVYRALTGRNPD